MQGLPGEAARQLGRVPRVSVLWNRNVCRKSGGRRYARGARILMAVTRAMIEIRREGQIRSSSTRGSGSSRMHCFCIIQQRRYSNRECLPVTWGTKGWISCQ